MIQIKDVPGPLHYHESNRKERRNDQTSPNHWPGVRGLVPEASTQAESTVDFLASYTDSDPCRVPRRGRWFFRLFVGWRKAGKGSGLARQFVKERAVVK